MKPEDRARLEARRAQHALDNSWCPGEGCRTCFLFRIIDEQAATLDHARIEASERLGLYEERITALEARIAKQATEIAELTRWTLCSNAVDDLKVESLSRQLSEESVKLKNAEHNLEAAHVRNYQDQDDASAIAADLQKRVNKAERELELLSSIEWPSCSGEWISGSGGHRKHNACAHKAVWWHPSEMFSYCEAHIVEHEKKRYWHVSTWLDQIDQLVERSHKAEKESQERVEALTDALRSLLGWMQGPACNDCDPNYKCQIATHQIDCAAVQDINKALRVLGWGPEHDERISKDIRAESRSKLKARIVELEGIK